MMQIAPPPNRFYHRHAHDWLEQIFACRAAETGGVIRRQVLDVDREVGRAAFEAEVRRRGFRLLRTRNHYIIVCEAGPIDMIV